MFGCVWLGPNLYTPPHKPVDSDASGTPGVAAHGCDSVQASGTPAHGCKGGEAMGVLGLGPGSWLWLGLGLGSGSYTHTHTSILPLPHTPAISNLPTATYKIRQVHRAETYKTDVLVYGCFSVWVWVCGCMYGCVGGRMGVCV